MGREPKEKPGENVTQDEAKTAIKDFAVESGVRTMAGNASMTIFIGGDNSGFL